jgi:hypothetical protein
MSFDYRALGTDVAAEMRARASRSLQRASVLDVGRELIAAKKLVAHGFFRDWVQTACQIHTRTAERIMQAALLVEKDDKLSYLPPDGLLALASRSAPEPVVSEIMEEIGAGERPTAARIKRRIAQAKQAEKGKLGPRQEDEPQEVQDRSQSEKDAATNALIVMLLAWDRCEEFIALLNKADLCSFAQALRNHHDTFATISVAEDGPAPTGFSQTPRTPEPFAATLPSDCIGVCAEAPLSAPPEILSETATNDRAEAATEAPQAVVLELAATEAGPPMLLGEVTDTPNHYSGSAEELSAPLQFSGQTEGNERLEAPSEVTRPAPSEPSSGVSAEKPRSQWYGRQWVADGAKHPQEHHTFTEALAPFRAAARNASDTELQRFLALTAPQAA